MEPEKVIDATEQLAKLDKAHEVGLAWMGGEPYTLSGALNGMAACIHDISRSFCILGRYAMAIKEMSEEKTFVKVMREKFEEPGICSLRTIYNSMAVAKFAKDKGIHFDYFRELPKMKQLMLSAAGDDEIGEDGTIFGLSPDEIKSTRVKDLRKIIEKQKEELLAQSEIIEQGRDQVMDLREKVKGLKDRTKILGATEQDTREKLEKDEDLIRGILDARADEITPSKLTPSQVVLIKAHIAAVDALVETWADEVARKLQS